ncbi:Ig-like domain-containing protein [Acinetobacter junii]|uniref:Ig-like domain-containing protein n=8 Tax=Acinetobacter junii TaxID=40215 RepID=UPI001F30D528|nr:Ig-like domain-containing protein [Acinetobacter junii]
MTSAVSANGGTVTINADGTLNYTPALNYVGDDVVTYTVTDSTGLSTTGTLTVTVTAVNNDAPITAPDTATTAEDTLLANINVLANDSDPDAGDVLTVTSAVSANGGTVTINADGTLNYTPALNYVGDDVVTYTVTDSTGLSTTGTLTVTVTAVNNDAPITAPDTATTAEDTLLANINVLANDSDPDAGDVLTVTSAVSANGGTVTINADGTLNYTPALNYVGDDVVTYTVTDAAGQTTTSTITVTVTGVNDVPVATPTTATTNEDTAVTLTPSVTDPDAGDVLTVTSAVSANGGTVTINADGTLNYTPALNYVGDDVVTYTVTDAAGQTTTSTITVTVTGVNDVPVATPTTATTNEDTAVTLTPSVTDPDAGDVLTVTSAVSANGGTVTINADGTLNYTPALNYVGDDVVTYTVTDAAGQTTTSTITVTVTGVNDAPVATPTTATTNEDTAVTLTPSVTDPDAGDVLTVTSAVSANGGTVTINADGTLNYTPALNYVGDDVVTYTVTDSTGLTTTGTLTVTVTAVNDAPIAVDDVVYVPKDISFTSTTSVLANDTDVDSPILTVQSFTIAGDTTVYNVGQTATITGVGTFTMDTTGNYTFTPIVNYSGPVPLVTYTVTDGTLTDTGVLSLTIDPLDAINDVATLNIGNVTATVGPEIQTTDVQVLGLAEASNGTDGSASVVIDSYSVLHVEVSQEALVAVADGYRVDIVDAAGNIVASTNPNDPNLVGQVLTPIIGGTLGLSGTNTLTADFLGLPAGTYSVVVHNDQNQLSRLLDSDGSGGVSLQELGDNGILLGAENQTLIVNTVVNALNNPILGIDLNLGSTVEPLLNTVLNLINTTGQETPVSELVGILGDILSDPLILPIIGDTGLSVTGVLDSLVSTLATTLLANTLTLLQTTTITTQLTEYNVDPANSTITGNNVISDADPAGNDVLGIGITTVTKVSYTNAAGVTTIEDVDPLTGANIVGDYGILHINADGSYTYTANGNPAVTGPEDIFTYTLSDGFTSDTATLTINLTDNVAPTQTPNITAISTDTGTQGDWSTADNSPTIIGTLNNPLLPGEKVQVQIDGGAWVDAYMDPNDTNAADGWTWFYGSNDLTVGNHTVAVRLIDGSGNVGTNTDTQAITIEGNQAPIPIVNQGLLGGLIGADLLGLIDLGDQTYIAYDPDNNLQSISISYQVPLDLSTGFDLAASNQIAAELGLQFSVVHTNFSNTVDNNGTPLNPLDDIITTTFPSSTLTITAIDGGVIDNLAVNELLRSVYLTATLNLGVAPTYSITTTDMNGLTDTDSATTLIDIGLFAGSGDPTVIQGTPGDNIVNGTSANQHLYGFAGDDILLAGDGDDLLRGGAGTDQLFGEDGDDVLVFDAADTVIDGGMGNDTLLITITTAAILGSATAVHDIEKIQLGTENEAVTLTLGADGAAKATGAGSQLFVEGDGNDTLNLLGGVFVGQVLINGQAYEQYSLDGTTVLVNPAVAVTLQDSTITGTTSGETLNGTIESETLSGLDGDDTLNAGAGNDLLLGGNGNDVLNGQAGNDTLTGGLGADTAIFNVLDNADNAGGNGFDAWNDFHLGNTATDPNADVIDISNLLVGYTGDGSAPSLAGYVSVSSDGTTTTISIDRDGGAGGLYSNVTLLSIDVDTTLTDLINNNQLNLF